MELQSKNVETTPIAKMAVQAPIDRNGIVSIFDTHEQAEVAVKQLQRGGFDLKKLSIVGKDYQTEENITGFYNLGERTKYWGKQGLFWGGLWGILFGSAMLVIPGVGPLLVAGSFAATIVGAVEGAIVAGGLSALGAALFSLGVPKDSILNYEAAVKAGKFMMITHGTLDDLKLAREIVKNNNAKSVEAFEADEVPSSSAKPTMQ
jgi:hypothetical protein